MIQSDGKNKYKDNTFSFWEWSAPILQTPEEVIAKVHELKLTGRVVKSISAVGIGYNWSEYEITESVYNALEKMKPESRALIPNPDDFLPSGVKLPCFAEIDEPLLIIFEDGDVLGISFDEGSCVRMELNTIPVTIKPDTNRKNFHADRLFDDMIGRRIVSVEVTASTEKPVFTGSFGLYLNEQPSYISKLALIYDDETCYYPHRRLSFEPWYDYGWVNLIDYDGQTLEFDAEKAMWIAEGFIKAEE